MEAQDSLMMFLNGIFEWVTDIKDCLDHSKGKGKDESDLAAYILGLCLAANQSVFGPVLAMVFPTLCRAFAAHSVVTAGHGCRLLERLAFLVQQWACFLLSSSRDKNEKELTLLAETNDLVGLGPDFESTVCVLKF
jgi:hypothetical protein